MPHRKKVNILLVDDHEEGLIALEAVLNHPDYNLVKARSGREALARVLEFDFAVIIMDVQMPGMDGFETVGLIKKRERSKTIPVIFVTAISKENRLIQHGYQSGAVDYLFKPFDPAILASKVSVLVELHNKTQQVREQAEQLRRGEIRERTQQLAALQLESLNRYRYLADAIPHILWKLQCDGMMEYCNRVWSEYTGLTTDKSHGKGWQAALHPKDLEVLNEQFQLVCDKGEAMDVECRLQNADGDHRWHLFRAVPEFNLEGSVDALIVTATDIDDRKQIEKDLIRAKEESLAANEAKSAFLANMSHEIRTPLGIVLGFSELLANPEISVNERESCLTTIRKNGELLSRLIGDVLDLSKIEAGHLQIEKVDFTMADFMATAAQSFKHQAQDKGIKLTLHFETAVPKIIHSDPMRLRQLLFNVVGNAIKFTERGEVAVIVACDSDKGLMRISVSDEGVGISNDQAKKLFRPFIQADSSTTRKFGGTGLGLSLSRKLARKLGGDVVLGSSEPGKGSTFIITIATGDLAGVEFFNSLEAEVPQKTPSQKKYNLNGTKVLVVEDAPENQTLLNHFLSIAGAEVQFADNGREGVDKALAGDYDLILMDIQMPVLDGYQATRELRKKDYNKPILALTAHALKEERERCLAAGCNDHLTKPVNRDELLRRVSSYISPGDNGVYESSRVGAGT